MNYDGPVVLVVLDGVGLKPDYPGNAVSRARTPFLARAVRDYLHVALDASGESVGLTPGQMGNSEVGHNTMGAGQAVLQGVARVNEAFKSGSVFRSNAWQGAVSFVLNNVVNNEGGTLHFAGIFSDGGVHSHIEHLYEMIMEAYKAGVRKMRVHAVFDGRDVGPFTAAEYVKQFEEFVKQFSDADIRIADGGGRMVYVADRYESDWQVVARGWDAMVNGEADYYFKSVDEALSILRRVKPDCQDQFLPAFVIVDKHDYPVGTVKKGDAFIYFDFRADRAVEIARAFTEPGFNKFSRGNYRVGDVYFAGMMEYDNDKHIPAHQLVSAVSFGETLHEFLSEMGKRQLAVSETVKFGHITYYFDGNSYDELPGEKFVEIKSDTLPLEERPWMKSAEITDEVVKRMEDYDFVRLNFPGGDMVGHTADILATTMAIEAIDICLARIAKKVDELGGMMMIVADHGNAEELLNEDGSPKTAHTINKVPCIFYDNTANRNLYELNDSMLPPSLEDIASTVAVLLGLNNYPDKWEEPLIKLKNI